MRAPLRLLLLPLLLLLNCATGCASAVLWVGAGAAAGPADPGQVRRARLRGEILELVADYGSSGPCALVVRLDQSLEGSWCGPPDGAPQAAAPREPPAEPLRESPVAHPLRLARAGDPVDVSSGDASWAGLACESAPADLGQSRWERLAGRPRPPTLYYGAPLSRGEGSLNVPDGQAACLRRAGHEPVYVWIPRRRPRPAAKLAYVGAGLLTPLTLAIDLASLPIQVVVLVVLVY